MMFRSLYVARKYISAIIASFDFISRIRNRCTVGQTSMDFESKGPFAHRHLNCRPGEAEVENEGPDNLNEEKCCLNTLWVTLTD